MLFSRKGKLKREFDDRLVTSIKGTKEALLSAKVIEELMDDYSLEVIAERKKMESIHYYLYKEARIRRVLIK